MVDYDGEGTRNSRNLLRLAQQTATVAAVVAFFIIAIMAIGAASDVLLVVFAGLLFAIFLHALSSSLCRYSGLSETLSLVIVMTMLLLILSAFGWFLVPKLMSQGQQLRQQIPQSWSSLREQIGKSESGDWLLDHVPTSEQILPQPEAILSRTRGVVTSAVGIIGVFVMIFFIGLMLAAQPKIYIDGFLNLVPASRRDRGREVLTKVGTSLRWWLVAKVAAMVVVGLLTWLGLWGFGIQLAAALGVLAAVMTFIPNFGPIISATPAVLLGLMQGPQMALWIVLLFIGIQLLESYVVTPAIQYGALSMPPVLVVAAQLAGGAWMGVLGLALATPLLAAAMVLTRLLYQEDILHETPSATSES